MLPHPLFSLILFSFFFGTLVTYAKNLMAKIKILQIDKSYHQIIIFTNKMTVTKIYL